MSSCCLGISPPHGVAIESHARDDARVAKQRGKSKDVKKEQEETQNRSHEADEACETSNFNCEATSNSQKMWTQ